MKKFQRIVSVAASIAMLAASTTLMADEDILSAAALSYTSTTFTYTNPYITETSSPQTKLSFGSDSKYYLYDQTRNIKLVSRTTEGHGSNDAVPVPKVEEIQSFSAPSSRTAPADSTLQKVATFYNVQAVYDWYARLGFSNFGSGSSNVLYVAMDNAGTAYSAVSKYHINHNVDDNSSSNLVDFSWVTFGEKPSSGYLNLMSKDRDVVGHEMTHIMLKKKVGWYTDSINETQAIMEAYCDILGELADDNSDWKIGYDSYASSYCIRDLANPESTKTPNILSNNTMNGLVSGSFYTDYELLKKEQSSLLGKNGGASASSGQRSLTARASTIISHAAYLMNKYGISRTELASIWLKSLDYYSRYCNCSTAAMTDCRKAVTAAANDYFAARYDNNKRMKMLEIVSNAFDSVHVFTTTNDYVTAPLTYTSVSQNIAANSTNMSNFVRAESQKYINGRYWYGSDINTCSSTPPAAGLDNGISVAPTYGKAFSKSFKFENEEPYYQCAGYAKKLQMDYFETTKFLHLNKSDINYSPRVGDHLRIIPQKYAANLNSENWAHSIFITAVNGSTITYTDCNSNGNQNIRWSKTATFDSSDTTIKLDNVWHNVMWVERPMMLGDVNGDSVVNSSDLTLIQTIISKGKSYKNISDVELTYRNFAADVNKDGSITSADYNLLKTQIGSTSGITLGFVK